MPHLRPSPAPMLCLGHGPTRPKAGIGFHIEVTRSMSSDSTWSANRRGTTGAAASALVRRDRR
jgi:hypothetical protein